MRSRWGVPSTTCMYHHQLLGADRLALHTGVALWLMILATTNSYILDPHDEQSMYVHATFLIRRSW